MAFFFFFSFFGGAGPVTAGTLLFRRSTTDAGARTGSRNAE
jgi:hypothetical protein